METIISENFSFFPPTSFWDVLIMVFIVCFLIQVFYYFYFFLSIVLHKKTTITTNNNPVSVIVCAKNERENLLAFLPLILSQNYPHFEVIVVNDNSVDDTQDVLKAFSLQHSNLKIVTVPDNDRFYGNKKFALTLGIKAAKYERVLLTDADCKPLSTNWLNLMSNYTSPQKKIILGIGNYEKQKGWLNKLIRFETLYTAIQYTSFALKNIPYMGVGRNLAYHTSLFFNNKGFASHYHILSGDDDLFINEVANSKNTQVVLDKDAHTLSVPKTTLKAWIRQKQRHLLTGKHYQLKHQLLLGAFMLSNLFFVVLFIVLVFNLTVIHLIVTLFILKYLIQIIIFKLSANKLGNEDVVIFTPFFELFFMVFQPILVISNFVKKRIKWN